MRVLRTSGINYPTPPAREVSANDGFRHRSFERHEDPDTSSLHLEFDVQASVGGKDVQLFSPEGTCGSQCRTRGGAEAVGAELQRVDVVRFAKEGRSDFSPGGVRGLLFGALRFFRRVSGSRTAGAGFKWLVTMQDGYTLGGTLTPGDDARLRLEMAGRMIITYQPDFSSEPERLASRKAPVLAGPVDQWPPRGATLQLTNGPIEYYREADVDDESASPVLVVTSNRIHFGQQQVSLLTVLPEITAAIPLAPSGEPWTAGTISGLRLEWTDTRSLVDPTEPPVAFYHVYRRLEDDDLNGWMLFKVLPADRTTWIDETFDGTTGAFYLVLHAASYEFDYHYEGSFGAPTLVPRLVD